MTRVSQITVALALAAQGTLAGQAPDAATVLAGMRAALGGEATLAAVKSIAVEGRITRARPDGSSSASDFEMFMELPDKYVKRDAIGQIAGAQLMRRSGFNGADVIEQVDAPPSMGGAVRIMQLGPNAATPGGQATPEQLETQMRASLLANRREFARFALGMFGTVSAAYPVEFSYAGQAESPDGKADILDVKAADGFSARLFIDAATHLPLMLTWMDKEPLRMETGRAGGPGGVQVFQGNAGGHSGSPEDAERMRQELQQRVRDAEARRRIVEFRLFYAEYKAVDGVRLPAKIQRMVDGIATEEIELERVKVNQKLAGDTFKTK